MTVLHTVNKSPFERNSLEACIDHATDGSAVLLIEDAVIGAVAAGDIAARIKAANGIKIYVLGPDLAARGMTEDQVIDGVDVVDYGGFVDLAATHDTVHAWM
jgi:tRNA 2-thiouridine synthesizing protein B